MGRKKANGICSICNMERQLSYEHVPPKQAFNEKRIIEYKLGKHVLSLGAEEIRKGDIKQKGMGEYTLCKKCNNDTGSWYAKNFIDWSYQGMDILIKTHGKPTLIYLNYLFPLRIIKQIIVMFFTVCNGRIGKVYPYLQKFVLEKEKMYLPPNIRIFVYYNIEGHFRWMGNSLQLNFGSSLSIDDCLELSFPPYGYYMSCSGMNSPNKNQFEITHFAKYRYNDFSVAEMQLPVLPTWSMIPGDYSTKSIYDASNKKSGFRI